LREVLWEPLEVEGGFHPGFLDGEKNNLKLSIESILDNKSAYAEQRLIEEMCRGEPFRLYEQGRVADIPGIEPRSLLELHRRVVREYPFHLYIAGDLDVEATRALAMDVFSPGGSPRTGGLEPNPVPGPVPVRGVREVEERMVVNQAKLFLGFRHGITYAHPSYEALLLMNGVLGAFSHSKLFQNVREKANLAYSIHSSVERTKGLLFIGSGIAPENHKKTLEIILEQVRLLKAGDISDDEMGATVSTILNSNEMLEDNLSALADVDLIWRLHGRELDLMAFRERIARVSKEEVIEAARCLEHDTTYLLTA
jgi:predicted Zn-dependent peptidase